MSQKKTKTIKLSPTNAFNPYKLMGGERCKIMDATIKSMATEGLQELIIHIPHKGHYHIKKWDPSIDTPYVKYFEYMITKAK